MAFDVKVNYKKSVLFEICCLQTILFYKFKFYTTNSKNKNKTFFIHNLYNKYFKTVSKTKIKQT